MAQLKDQNKTPETDSKEMQICELPDKEFNINAIKMLSEVKREHRQTTKQIQKNDA